jgi:putative SOS response-associated peptidase YedK
MCGRFDQHVGPERLRSAIERLAGLAGLDWTAAPSVRRDGATLVVPTQSALVVALLDRRLLLTERPFGVRSPRGSLVINARRETLRARPLFREARERGRLLVPVVGFDESAGARGPGARGHRRSVHFHWEGELAWLAGLGVGEGFVIVTEASAAPVEAVHDREPVALDDEAALAWLRDGDLPLPGAYGPRVAEPDPTAGSLFVGEPPGVDPGGD